MSHPVAELSGQAERHYVRLQAPNCSDAERAECLRWRQSSPAHEAAYQEVALLWRQSEALRGNAELDAMLREDEAREARAGRVWLWPTLVSSMALVLVLTFWWPEVQQSPSVRSERFQTAIGEQRRVALPDGSTMVLDTDSSATALFSESQRLIELENGQARFSVAHEAQRPFQVRAAGGVVTAIGTEFLVRTTSAADGATVTLLEGRVQVDGPKTSARWQVPATLSPGQQLRYDRSGEWNTTQVDISLIDAWTRGTVYADSWRLADLLSEMNRYSATQVRVVDPDLAELRVSGTFRTGDPQALAQVLALSWPVQAVPQADQSLLLTRRAQPE